MVNFERAANCFQEPLGNGMLARNVCDEVLKMVSNGAGDVLRQEPCSSKRFEGYELDDAGQRPGTAIGRGIVMTICGDSVRTMAA